jgi:hypothetical protein
MHRVPRLFVCWLLSALALMYAMPGIWHFRGQTDSLSEIDLTQPTINDLQAIAG